MLGYFQELHCSLCGWRGRAWGPSGSVLKWQRGRGCCAHLLWAQVAATLLMGPRALVTSQICRPGLRKCSPPTPSEESKNIHFGPPHIFFSSYSLSELFPPNLSLISSSVHFLSPINLLFLICTLAVVFPLSPYSLHISSMFPSAFYICVCVCVKEEQRDAERVGLAGLTHACSVN